MNQKPSPRVIYPRRDRIIVLVAVSAALVLLPFLALLLLRDRIEEVRALSLRLYAVLWMGIGLFLLLGSAGLIYNLWQLVRPRPAATIRGEGLELAWFGLIRWEEIDHVAPVDFQGQRLLGVFPKDLEGFLSRQPRLRQGLIRRALAQGFPPLYVTQMALPLPVEELLSEIGRYAGVPLAPGGQPARQAPRA